MDAANAELAATGMPPFTSVTDGFTRGYPLFAKLGSADQARVIAALAGALGLLSKGETP